MARTVKLPITNAAMLADLLVKARSVKKTANHLGKFSSFPILHEKIDKMTHREVGSFMWNVGAIADLVIAILQSVPVDVEIVVEDSD